MWEYFDNFEIITNICNFNIDTITGRTKSSSLYDTVSSVKEYGIQFLSLVRRVSVFFLYFFMVYRLVEQVSGAQLQLFHIYEESPLSSPLIHHKGFRFTSSFKLMLQPTCLTVSLQLVCETLVRPAWSSQWWEHNKLWGFLSLLWLNLTSVNMPKGSCDPFPHTNHQRVTFASVAIESKKAAVKYYQEQNGDLHLVLFSNTFSDLPQALSSQQLDVKKLI